jgi:CBS-domain-containing membrane protein
MTETALQPLPPPRRRSSGRLTTWAIGAVLAVTVGIALAVAAAAAVLIAVLGAVAVLVVRLARRAPDGPATLEGRRTPEGWVAEASPR